MIISRLLKCGIIEDSWIIKESTNTDGELETRCKENLFYSTINTRRYVTDDEETSSSSSSSKNTKATELKEQLRLDVWRNHTNNASRLLFHTPWCFPLSADWPYVSCCFLLSALILRFAGGLWRYVSNRHRSGQSIKVRRCLSSSTSRERERY